MRFALSLWREAPLSHDEWSFQNHSAQRFSPSLNVSFKITLRSFLRIRK
jgi:hypothetical protein